MATPHIHAPAAEEGAALRKQIAEIQAEIAAHAAQFAEQLKTLKAQLDAKSQELLALGRGRYGSDAEHLVTVVAATEPKLSPDTFALRSKEDEERARELAGDDFLKLFDRIVYFEPKEDFRGLTRGLLKPKKALALVDLCLVPGQLTGGRAAHLRWE